MVGQKNAESRREKVDRAAGVIASAPLLQQANPTELTEQWEGSTHLGAITKPCFGKLGEGPVAVDSLHLGPRADGPAHGWCEALLDQRKLQWIALEG